MTDSTGNDVGGTALWPALWMLGSKIMTETAYEYHSSWPRSAEIDIMEANGFIPDKVSHAFHYDRWWPFVCNPIHTRQVNLILQIHIIRMAWHWNGEIIRHES